MTILLPKRVQFIEEGKGNGKVCYLKKRSIYFIVSSIEERKRGGGEAKKKE